ncbi:MAG: hypothetical protein RL701_967 [Pseudomonadota bacterium]
MIVQSTENLNRTGWVLSPCAPALTTDPLLRKPHVLLLGGQDAPSAARLQRDWCAHMVAALPAHRLSTVSWQMPAADGGGGALSSVITSCELDAQALKTAQRIRHAWLPEALDRSVAAWVTGVVAHLDTAMHIVDRRPNDLRSQFVYRFTRFSVDALHDREGRGAALSCLALRALELQPDVIVAHSFGGTLALRAAAELSEYGDRPLRLITLGTNCGRTVTTSPMFADSARTTSGRLRLPRALERWQHFYSSTDAIVGAPALPHEWDDVEIRKVDTGAFTRRGFGHALRDYLATSEVTTAVAGCLKARANQTYLQSASL